MVVHGVIRLSTRGHTDIVDITSQVEEVVSSSGVTRGVVTVSIAGSTGSLTTMEFEPGLVTDLRRLLDELVPADRPYAHDAAWGDANGFSHLRASLLGPSVTLPVLGGRVRRGTWQQIVFIDFDRRARQRSLDVVVLGD